MEAPHSARMPVAYGRLLREWEMIGIKGLRKNSRWSIILATPSARRVRAAGGHGGKMRSRLQALYARTAVVVSLRRGAGPVSKGKRMAHIRRRPGQHTLPSAP